MHTETFTSPLSFYTVETNFNNDALTLQPEERRVDFHADSGSPFPYFGDELAGGIAHDVPFHDTFMI